MKLFIVKEKSTGRTLSEKATELPIKWADASGFDLLESIDLSSQETEEQEKAQRKAQIKALKGKKKRTEAEIDAILDLLIEAL